jgi:hypothetical protein
MAKTKSEGDTRDFKVVYGIVQRGERTFWTRIGAAFPNRDGSINVALDFLPASPEIMLHIRDPKADDPA